MTTMIQTMLRMSHRMMKRAIMRADTSGLAVDARESQGGD
jgi:hypothetical protein